ncbi:cyclopropane-fatty-acyl-phospholipid synthase family protein [Mesorhizobium sp. ZMM04-5]|uniref:Cyclopropane-fatty-acyl-phospholipid synthase family protein n=1 Tax=Mesorhizobium marinum TaxID=3228790 RepID=A0ABV3QVC2_9HYPH
MGLIDSAARLGEAFPWPDAIVRKAIDLLVARTDRRLGVSLPLETARFAGTMSGFPVAVHTADANNQHYELPERFFSLILGPRRKYSCCLFASDQVSLGEAEEQALAETATHADLHDGHRILELGCGWGSLSLWMAERFPNASIMVVSNSHSQRSYIVGEAAKRGLSNLTVVTADMNHFSTDQTFDRVVSVEMFEHMANWQVLLLRMNSWLAANGRAFIHVFSHTSTPYRFDHNNPADWIAKHFFTGGLMPSHGLMREFPDSFIVEHDWRWNGNHYRRTADAWLMNYDGNADEISAILRDVYGKHAALWARRWRLFFLATSALFGHADGEAWGVSHYRLVPSPRPG